MVSQARFTGPLNTTLPQGLSIGGNRLVMAERNDKLAALLVQQQGVSDILARLLAQRNIPADKMDSFLNPRLSRDFPNPFSLDGMDALSEHLASCIIEGKQVAVLGDFDVDGATSTAVLTRFFRHCGMEIPFYIPDRLTEGYGPNQKALRSLKDQGAETVIMVDCGIAAVDSVRFGRDIGLDIAILDHHEPGAELPPASFIVNPKLKACDSALEYLAAVGVAFLTCVATNSALRDRGFFEKRGIPEAPLKSWLELVALGTVCDMVPLVGANRLFVRSGFHSGEKPDNPGLQALCAVSKIAALPTVDDAGFMLGPRINAGSRVHKSDLGARLLSTDDPEEASNLAWMLDDCNRKRQSIQQTMQRQAIKIVETQGMENDPLILLSHEDWHPGLVGLVAGRIKERFGRPTCAVSWTPGEEGMMEGRGSGRSVAGVNLAAAFIDARDEGLLIKGGGHAMAAGFTVAPGSLPPLKDFLQAHATRQMNGEAYVNETIIDGVLSIAGANLPFVQCLHSQFGPFGTGNAEPLFLFPDVRIFQPDIVGRGHIRAFVGDAEGGTRIKAIQFGAEGTPTGDAIMAAKDQNLHVIGHLKIDSWNGTDRVSLHIVDLLFADQLHHLEQNRQIA